MHCCTILNSSDNGINYNEGQREAYLFFCARLCQCMTIMEGAAEKAVDDLCTSMGHVKTWYD